MTVETATYIGQLTPTLPPRSDLEVEGADHLRLIKSTLQATFPIGNKAFNFPVSNKTVGNYTVVYPTDQNSVQFIDATVTPRTVTLPNPGSPANVNSDGWTIWIVKFDSSVNAVTINGAGNNISGSATYQLSFPRQIVRLVWSNQTSDWTVFDNANQSPTPTGTIISNTTLGASALGSIIEANPNAGNFTLTLTAAATLGLGWFCEIRHSGTVNQVILTSPQNVGFEGGAFLSRSLQPGECLVLFCDGVQFYVIDHTPPFLSSRGPSLLTVVSQVTALPVGATPGARYLVLTAFAPFNAGDIIEFSGVGTTFNGYTPPANAGWLAYVQTEGALYQFISGLWRLPGAFGQCQLTKSGSNLLLLPYNGNYLTIAGGGVRIPDAGVTLNTGGLAAATYYYIYAAVIAGVLTLEASTTAPAAVAGGGYKVKSGDSTRTLVGAAYTDAGPAWADTDGKRWVLSWFNRRRKKSRTGFSTSRSTASGVYVEINSEIRNQFISWFEEDVFFSVVGAASTNSAPQGTFTGIAFDGTTAESEETACFASSSIVLSASCGFFGSKAAGVLTEAATHYATLLGRVTASTGSWTSTAPVTSLEVWVNG
jgi:hypothetical protein